MNREPRLAIWSEQPAMASVLWTKRPVRATWGVFSRQEINRPRMPEALRERHQPAQRARTK